MSWENGRPVNPILRNPTIPYRELRVTQRSKRTSLSSAALAHFTFVERHQQSEELLRLHRPHLLDGLTKFAILLVHFLNVTELYPQRLSDQGEEGGCEVNCSAIIHRHVHANEFLEIQQIVIESYERS